MFQVMNPVDILAPSNRVPLDDLSLRCGALLPSALFGESGFFGRDAAENDYPGKLVNSGQVFPF